MNQKSKLANLSINTHHELKFSDKDIKDAKQSYYFDGALRLHFLLESKKHRKGTPRKKPVIIPLTDLLLVKLPIIPD